MPGRDRAVVEITGEALAIAFLPFGGPAGTGGRGGFVPTASREAAGLHDLVLAAFTDVPKPPPDEVLGLSSEVVLIERSRSASLGFRAALEQTVRKCRPVRTADI